MEMVFWKVTTFSIMFTPEFKFERVQIQLFVEIRFGVHKMAASLSTVKHEALLKETIFLITPWLVFGLKKIQILFCAITEYMTVQNVAFAYLAGQRAFLKGLFFLSHFDVFKPLF